MLANKKSLLALSIASVLTLSGCFSDDDNNVVVEPPTKTEPEVEIVAPEVDTEQPSKVFSVNVIDITNDEVRGNVLEGATVSFLVNGEPATTLTNVNEEDLASVTVDDSGSFTFLTKAGASGEVTALVTQDGYVSKSFLVDLDAVPEGDAKDIPLTFGLVSLTETQGVVAKTTPATVASSTTEVISAGATEGSAGADLSVPVGTSLQDADGNVIEGEVAISVLAADSTNTNTGLIIPEGLNSADSDTVADVQGVTSITMTAGDTKVKQFTTPIDVSIALPADSGLNAGETLNVSSYNEDTGVWSSESQPATVVMNDDGSHKATFKTDHLTFFTVSKSADKCTDGIAVSINSGTVPAGGLSITLSSADGSAGSYIRGGQTSKTVIPASVTSRYGISEDATANVRLFDRSGRDWFTATDVPICGTIPVTLGSPVTLIEKTLVLDGTCAQKQDVSVDLSGSIVTYAKEGKAASIAQALGESKFRLDGLEDGASYRIRTTIRGAKTAQGGQSSAFNTTVTNDDADITQPVSLTCREVPVTGTD